MNEEITALKQQLAEKDKETERLHKYLELDWAMTPQRMDGKSMTKRKIIENWEKEIRHQVCEEIREKAKQDTHRGLYTITYADLYGIEKGE